MGRPPIGKRAMTAAEKQRRYRARKFGNKPRVTKSALAAEIAALKQQLAQAHKRIAELERRGELTRGRRDSGQTGAAVFSEVGKLCAEIVKLKSDIIKLNAMLQEEPDAAKLRKKVVDQQVEMTSMRDRDETDRQGARQVSSLRAAQIQGSPGATHPRELQRHHQGTARRSAAALHPYRVGNSA